MDNNNPLQSLIAKFAAGDAHGRTDLMSLGSRVQKQVNDFLVEHNLGSAENGIMRPSHGVSLESLDADMGGVQSLTDLIDEAGVAEDMRDIARDALVTVMAKYYATNGNPMARHMRKPEHDGSPRVALEGLFSTPMVEALASTEAFGRNIDTVTADLGLAMTVTLMKFHMGLMPRVLPTIPTDTPSAVYRVPRLTVFDLSDSTAAEKTLLDLQADPSSISSELVRIEPLNAVDEADHAGAYLAADNVILHNVNAPIIELSLDEDRPGFGKANWTDTVADNPKLDSIRVSLTVDGTTEAFDVEIPADMARLTRLANSADAADRSNNLSYQVLLVKGQETTAGAASTILASAEATDGVAEEGILLTLNGNYRLNLKTGIAFGIGTVSAASHRIDGGDLSEAFATTVGEADANITAATLTGYILDARYSEENMRKTSIAVRRDNRAFTFDIPIGRNYVADDTIGDDVDEDMPAILTRLMMMGEDKLGLDMTIDALNNVVARMKDSAQNITGNISIGRSFVAGELVRPTVISTTLDVTDILARQDSDRWGDVKQRMLSFLLALTARLQSGSFIAEQMKNGAQVTYRVATTIKVLSCALGLPHIHQGLDRSSAPEGGTSGVEYRIVLPNGVVLEVVTTNFSSMEDTMVIVPRIVDEPKSPLNFGGLWDMGPMVGQLTMTGDAVAKRVYANARQLLVPTCPVGAIVNVTGAFTAMEQSLASA
jgi:hypothetical protein